MVARTRRRKIQVNDKVGKVSALLSLPDDAHRLYVFAHGAGAGMEHKFMDAAAKALAARGVGTLRYNFAYMEAGKKRPDPPKTSVATVRAAIDLANEVADGLPIYAGGKSYGGRMTSTAASEEPLPGVEGLIFFGFPLHAPGRDSNDRAEHLYSVKVPMLFLQGDRDALANLDYLRPVVKKLGRRGKLHVCEGADHSFHVLKRSGRSDTEALEEITDAAANWRR